MPTRLLAVLTLAVAAYLALSSRELPPVVASHFAVGGAADGAMPRTSYLILMAVLTLGLPWLMTLVIGAVRRLPPRWINLPNRDWWLAPERRAATEDYLARQAAVFGALLMVFLAFVHQQVVAANRLDPPRLDERVFLPALVVFVAATVVWSVVFVVHFVRGPRR